MLRLRRTPINEVGKSGSIGDRKRLHADTNEAKARAVGLAGEELASGGKNPPGELGRMRQRAGAGADAEIRGLELERNRRAGKRIELEASGHLFAELPQPQLERSEIGNVVV